MSLFSNRLRLFFFGISEEEAKFSRRGFLCPDSAARVRLERVGVTFLAGYHAALADEGQAALAGRLCAVEPGLRGFAFEGAGMALELLDHLSPRRRDRLPRFLDGAGEPHRYMLHVGAGWAMARLPLGLRRRVGRLDPLLRWLAYDGYGFHEGYFHWRRYRAGRAAPRRLLGYERRAFDQGLGRSLWFAEGAEVGRVAAAVEGFPEARRGDLWSGVGLACTYAGGASRSAIESLRASAGRFAPHLAQGAAFAAAARLKAGNPEPHTELACSLLCGRSADEAAHVTDMALRRLPPDGDTPAYEVWRRRIRELLTGDSSPES
jgi:enediyne biosynthesis protein E3